MDLKKVESDYIVQQLNLKQREFNNFLTLRYNIALITFSLIVGTSAFFGFIISGLLTFKNSIWIPNVIIIQLIAIVLLIYGWRYFTHKIKSEEITLIPELIWLKIYLNNLIKIYGIENNIESDCKNMIKYHYEDGTHFLDKLEDFEKQKYDSFKIEEKLKIVQNIQELPSQAIIDFDNLSKNVLIIFTVFVIVFDVLIPIIHLFKIIDMAELTFDFVFISQIILSIISFFIFYYVNGKINHLTAKMQNLSSADITKIKNAINNM